MDLSKLTDKQLDVAMKVIEEAERQGINPDFVLPLVYQESRLGQNIGPSKAGAIGVMQLMPETAKYLGVDPNDMDQNIEGGVRYIKMLSEKLNADPNLVAVAYNAGPNSAFFKTGKTEDLPDETVTYVDSLIEYAGGNLPPPLALKSEPAKPVVPEKGFESPPVSDAFGQAVNQAVSPPSALGSSPPDVTGGPMGGRPQLSADEQRRIEKQRNVGQTLGAYGGAGVGGLRMTRDILKGGMPPPQAPGPRAPGMQGMTPGQKWAQKVTGYVKPGTESVVEAATDYRRAMPQGKVSGPTAKRYGLNAPLDIARQQPRVSGLDQVSKTFRQIANSSPVRAAGRYALPPVAIGYGLGETMAASEGLKAKQPDYLDIGASGLGALGAGLTLVPNPVARGAGALMMGVKPALDVMRAPGTPPEGMIGDTMAP